MLRFTIVSDKVVLDPNIVLLEPLHKLYKTKDGPKLLQAIFYLHSRDISNPFRDLEQFSVEENVIMAVFKKSSISDLNLSVKVKALFDEAERVFIKHNLTSEGRLEKAIDKKLDEITTMLNENVPRIEESVTNSGEIKFNTNLTIILNLFTKIETILKSKNVLQSAIRRQEGSGRIRGGGTTSFREMGILNKK